ncbi:MAG: DUF177 domain-containing protein [Pseudomonadota bacterium]
MSRAEAKSWALAELARAAAAGPVPVVIDAEVAAFSRLAGMAPGNVTFSGMLESVAHGPLAGRPRLHGEVTAAVTLACQRCLEPMPVSVAAQVDAPFVDGAQDDGGGDAWPVDDRVRFGEVVEEFVLLALPMVALHAAEDCGAEIRPEFDASPAAARRSPFAGLGSLVAGERGGKKN